MTTVALLPQTQTSVSSPAAGPCVLLNPDGVPLCRGRLEVHNQRLQLHAATPSGAIASAFFGRGRRRFLLALADGSTIPVFMRDCWWQDGERACELEPVSISMAA